MKDQVAALKKLTSIDNPDQQQAHIVVLEQKIGIRLAQLKQTVDLMMKGDAPAALKMVGNEMGKATMDDYAHVDVMQQIEKRSVAKTENEEAGTQATKD